MTKRDDGTIGALTPAEIQQLKRFMDEHRTTPTPFDIVTTGRVFAAVHDEQARALLRAHAAAGTTWCLEGIGPHRDVDGVRAAIQHGPPQLE